VHGRHQVGPARRPATVEDVHALAWGMPFVSRVEGTHGRAVYQVGRRSFVFFRNPRPDALDPTTGDRWDDVIVFWVPDETDKQALLQDPRGVFTTTSHFDGHPSVLVRASRLGELTYAELAELVEDAWLSQVSSRRRQAWLDAHPR
jgi:hypothetical protein